MAAILSSAMLGFRHCHLGFRHLVIFSQIHSKKTLTPFQLWLKLIQSDSNSFILTELDDGSHLEFCHLGLSDVSFSSQTHSHLARLVPTIFTKKNFTYSFWLNFMMAAILNSAMLDSDTVILDSDTLCIFSQIHSKKHSHSTLTLPQTNSFWLKLDDGSHLEFCLHGFIHFAQKELHLFILTELDDGSHLKFCHVGFRHWASWIQTPCYLLSDSLKNTLPPLWLCLKLIPSD